LRKPKEITMRIRSMYAIATALILFATLGAQTASAQSGNLKTNVPFEFYAAGKLHPPGLYIVAKVNPATLRLQHTNGGKAVFILANPERDTIRNGNWIVFNQYGTRSFLAGAYWDGASTTLRVPLSREEREVARIASQLPPVRIAAK
jgi:hypothetical protein